MENYNEGVLKWDGKNKYTVICSFCIFGNEYIKKDCNNCAYRIKNSKGIENPPKEGQVNY